MAHGYGKIASVAAWLGLLCSVGPAHALGRVLGSETENAEPVELRVAYADSGQRTAYWLSIHIRDAAPRVALVLPVPAQSAVDPASDAWLEALDEATAPRIVPESATGATAPAPTSVENTMAGRMRSIAPSEVAVQSSLDAVAVFAKAHGLRFDASDRDALARADASYLTLVYVASTPEIWTETVRLVVPSPGQPLELGAAVQSSDAVMLTTLFAFGSGRARLAPGTELARAAIDVTWNPRSNRSDYLVNRLRLLTQSADRFVVESAIDPWQPGDLRYLRAVPVNYFERAAELGLLAGDIDHDACASRAMAARSNGLPGARFAHACAESTLPSLVEPAPCAEGLEQNVIAADAVRCGGVDDLAIALSGLVPEQTTLTRIVQLSRFGAEAQAPSFSDDSDDAALSPVLSTSSTTLSGAGGSGAGGAGGSFSYPGGASGNDGTGGSYGGGEAGSGYVGVASPESAGAVDVSCGGETTPASSDDGSCDGDSSGDSEHESCGGDSSSSSGGGDDCSNDDSSGYDGDTCGKDDSSGYDGDTCSGDSQGGKSSDDCSIRRGRVPKPRFSVVVLALIALGLPLRRYTRARPKISGRSARRP